MFAIALIALGFSLFSLLLGLIQKQWAWAVGSLFSVVTAAYALVHATLWLPV